MTHKHKISFEELIEELDSKADLHNNSEMPEARRCYDQYITLIIKGSFYNPYVKERLTKYWEGITN